MREHNWQDVPGDKIWEQRRCKLCHLEDMRVRDRRANPYGTKYHWGVTTPCIEPVPEMVDYVKLVSELSAHKVPKFVRITGVPGRWTVGFWTPRGIYPELFGSSVEDGCAELLRWIRARQFDVYKYSDMKNQEIERESEAFAD